MVISRLAEWMTARQAALAHGAALALTPLFYVAAFPPYDVGEGAFVFLVPFVIWLHFRPGYRQVAWTSLAIGWISWLVLIFWLRHVTWLGMFLLSGVVGAHFMIWALGIAWLARRVERDNMWSGLPFVLGAGAAWVVVEHVRSWIFSGFPWLPLSASQWNQPIMLQSANVFGSWAISFALVILNVGVARYLLRLVDYARTKRRSICPEFYVALSILVALTFMQLRRTSDQQREPALKAGVVQPDIPQYQKWDAEFARDILGRLWRQTMSLSALDPDAVFWPESSLPDALNDDGALERWVTRMATEAGTPIYAGALGRETGEDGDANWYNSVFLVRPGDGMFPRYYSKRHLVPFGEYIPLRGLWPWIEKVVPLSGDLLPGEEPMLLPLYLEETTIQIGSLICFEDVFPYLARASVKEGAGLLYVATNSAWYGHSGASAQHMAHSVLRAVETRRVVLRVGNDGLTCWIDEYGNVIRKLSRWEQEWTAWQITRDRRWVGRETFYVKHGDWFVWVCWGLLAGCALWARPSGERKRGF